MSTTGARVPDEGVGGPSRPGWWWWPRRRSAVLDVALAAISAVEAAFEGATFAQRIGLVPGAGALLGVLVGSVLVLRRRWPVAVVLVAIAVTPAQMGFLLSLVGLYTLAASEVPRRITALLAGMNGLGTMVVAFVGFEDNLHDSGAATRMSVPLTLIVSVLMALGLTAPPVLLGLYVRARRRLVESLRERADGLERELELLAEKALERAERARADERTRIAREMHDVVAHRVSLMVVHAGALRATALDDPAKAAASAELIGDMGRQALTELRQMLGVLRAPAASAAAAPSAPRPAPGPAVLTAAADSAVGATGAPYLAPGGDSGEGEGPYEEGPVLDQLGALVRESQAAGTVVELTVEGESRPCGARIEATVYRVVQEALTNVHKHAAGARAQVRLAYRDKEIAVLITNGPSDGSPRTALPSGGHGLIGMRERVTAHGGGFAAGPTPEGGFRVSAMVPLP
ncbi:sensor histidine kinase [Actinacidiphila acididurans]|uniref:histidine kinase n=1 Tax=Actinacidiphila acididurans TaxID=2784346 RepID=A0ABS2TNV3_9ACTN|nr:histidine kinase [Actinacidiphila acididurans]MBM9505009.1 sensor histidine kinase [Actinacidiphila acididurans]